MNLNGTRLTLFLNLISFCFHLTGAEVDKNAEQHVALIKWVRNYYSTSAVFLLHSAQRNKNFDGFKITYLMYLWCRLLHRDQIATVSTSFRNMRMLARRSNMLRPLVIVFIPELAALLEFSNTAKSLKMSSFAWFVFFLPTPMNEKENYCYDPPGNIFNLFYDTEMLVMCADDLVLREWYSVDGNTTQISDLIKWHRDEELFGTSMATVDKLSNLSLYERRHDLKGKVLRAVTVKNSALITSEDNELRGFLRRAINELENTLNFTVDVVAEEEEYGSFNMTTKRWSGAIRLVASGELDVGLSDFSMTNIRLDYVDYTVPIITTKNCLYLQQSEMFAVKWFAYYKAYSFSLWMSLLMIIVVAQVVLIFMRARLESSSIIQRIFHEFIQIWGIFCQQGVAEFPRNSSLRLAYFTMLVTATVISAAYSASLISFVTARVRDLPFRTVDEFIEDGTYSIIIQKGSADYDMFAYSKDPLLVKVMKLIKPLNALPLDVESGLQSICEDPKLAFYSSYNRKMQKMSSRFRVPCKISCLDFGRVDNLSLTLSKNNQFTSVLNYYLQKFINTGLLNRFKNEVTFVEETRFQPVGFYSVASVLIIFLCGVALALVILIAEMYYNMCAI